MAVLTFKDFTFEDKKNKVRVNFLKIFYFDVDKESLEKIGKFKINNNKIGFIKISENKAQRKFNQLLEKGFNNLKNKLTNKKAIYIHKNSGIPLIGTNYFGLIDRGTNLIEIKPLTSCNLSCIFCSVDEGPKSKRNLDFVIEKDYLVEEFRKIVEFKQNTHIDAHINAQGEPLLYADIIELVEDIAKIKQVNAISIDTNGTLLNKKLIDDLAKAGLTRINLSLHSLGQEIANKMAGSKYNLTKVKEIAAYIAKKMDLILVPVWLKGYNDNELAKLAKFAEKIGAGKTGPGIGIQNFLGYKFGRNPIKPVEMDVFYKKLQDLEKKHNISLICKQEDFKIEKCDGLPKPFKRGNIVKVKTMFPGRLKNEMLAISNNRIISIPSCHKEGYVNIRIKKSKHNIFLGELLG